MKVCEQSLSLKAKFILRYRFIDITNENCYCLLVNSNTEMPKPAAPASGASKPPSRVSSEALLGASRQLVILHNGREYVLRLTQTGKLILTA